MKALLVGLSLLGLMMAPCILKAEEPASATDAEVLALVDAAAKAEKKSEADTPVFKAPEIKKEKAASGPWLWLRMVGSLVLVLVLFGGGIYAFRSFPAGKTMGKTRMIQVMAQHHIGAKKSLAVVRVAGETVLIGMTDHNITLLKSLSLLDEDAQTNVKFSNTLSQKITPEDEFSMKGLKEIIGERLKSMKELG